MRFHYGHGAEFGVYERATKHGMEHRIATPYGTMLNIKREYDHCKQLCFYNKHRSEHKFGGILADCLYVEIYAVTEVSPEELDGQCENEADRPDDWWYTDEVDYWIERGRKLKEDGKKVEERQLCCNCCRFK